MTVKVSKIITDQLGLNIVRKPVGSRQQEKAVNKVAQKTLAAMSGVSPPNSPVQKL